MIAKRTLLVSKKELEAELGLPDEVEIIAVRPVSGLESGWEFLLASAEEVDGITVYQDGNFGINRRISLQHLKELKNDNKNSE
jgi:hypothetical protein